MNVLVIPEDFRLDQYVLRPILGEVLARAGRPRARIRISTDSSIRGISRATDWNTLEQVLRRYKGMIELFLLIVDRDGEANRRAVLDEIERRACAMLGASCLIAEAAIEEVEVWALAGALLPKGWSWQEIRKEPHPKERFFEKYAEHRGLENEPGGGRETIALEAVKQFARVSSRCTADLGALQKRIAAFIATGDCPSCAKRRSAARGA